MRGDAAGEVAGRRAAEYLETELHGPRGRHRDDAVLVGERRMVDRVVLDVQLGDAELARQTRARTSGVKPELKPVFGSSTGSSSR